jgi:hypothetical protein
MAQSGSLASGLVRVARVQRERAVLTNEELGLYLEWQYPAPGRRLGVLEAEPVRPDAWTRVTTSNPGKPRV